MIILLIRMIGFLEDIITLIYTYDGCLNGTQNIHLFINGVEHIWPGSLYEGLSDPVASQRIWDFFSKYDINGVIQ